MNSTTTQDPAPAIRLTVPHTLHGKRLDAALAALLPDQSRSRLQRLVRDGHVRLDGRVPECSDKVAAGARIELEIPEPAEVFWKAQPIPLKIVHEDDSLLVINKPPGMVVHPGAGNPEGTLLNAVMHHAPSLEAVPRAGIVHRLDKDTSGLLVVAKTDAVRLRLVRELQARRIKREYLALVRGVVRDGGSVTAPIGRHPVHRTRMSVHRRGKEATSHYTVKGAYRGHTLLRVRLESGRTHQIRVHMAHIGHPVVGDPVYGGRGGAGIKGQGPRVTELLRAFRRQALHAERLGLRHPETGESMEWTAPMPEDMRALVEALSEDTPS
ncbi:MAG: 23S rRNA pseudouridine(1911/1915/1917) synthase RluD [Deltaproteobacteria bacterium]|nr:23S rRNA pseudouridine(1911/1915/1917) synthase RluD [Deltaproteobacteria bacterium]